VLSDDSEHFNLFSHTTLGAVAKLGFMSGGCAGRAIRSASILKEIVPECCHNGTKCESNERTVWPLDVFGHLFRSRSSRKRDGGRNGYI
jgi:hypothetical protein